MPSIFNQADTALGGTGFKSSREIFLIVKSNLCNGADSQAWQDGLCDPTLTWSPTPWGSRNRIYIANETDQVIYVGYFY